MKRKRIQTIRDLAHLGGVSVATVSRVLNQHPNVSRKTRERLLALIRESGFRPNAIARQLVRGRSGQVCFLLSNRDIVHSFHSRVLKGVEDYCRHHHRQVVFTVCDYGPEDSMPTPDLPRIVREHRAIDGVLIAGMSHPVLVRYIEELGLPYVVFGNNLVNGSLALPRRNSVSFEEEGGAREAAEFLVRLGHCHVTFVGDIAKIWYRRRYQGYCSAMRAAGLPEVGVDIRGGEDCVELGRRALPLLLRNYPSTTAILAQDDETACGLLDGLRKLGIRVPEDISLVGYDDIAEIQYLTPALTTVRVPKEKIGWTMAELLFQMTEGKRRPPAPPPLPTELIVRDSCTRAREIGAGL